MTRDSTPEDKRHDTGKPEREERSYAHGSGDRNAWSPTGDKGRMPRHEGGTQRDAPPEPSGGAGDD
ncbi:MULTISPECIES: hypothetical protein [unclassified Luteimonas]